MMYARITRTNGTQNEIPVIEEKTNEYVKITVPCESIGDAVQYIDLLPDYFTAETGEEGYFVMPCEASTGTMLTHFTEREDMEFSTSFATLQMLGKVTPEKLQMVIATGMMHYFAPAIAVKDGHYCLYTRYLMNGEKVYEDVSAEYYTVEKGNYADMARIYREYQLNRKGCKPLSERTKENEKLARAASVPAVRMRQAWKPVPSPVEYQTPETEPPVHAACTFKRIEDVLDEMQKQNVKGEICLVGWNIGGHDGRFPQIFPVEPKLGGENAMVHLIEKCKAMGMNIVCHDDATGAYSIADCWDEEYLVKNADGSLHKRPYCWGGGRPHKICARRQYERFEKGNIPKLASLGFTGIHYIDVMTILPLISCFDERHPVNHKDVADYYKKIMEMSREYIGGFSSESGYDYAAESLDYCMYTAFHVLDKQWNPIFDDNIPLWQMVYHGIILYNPCTDTLNYAVKKPANRLKFFEYGGRPLICFYANFAKGHNWMGLEDFLCDTDEQLKESVSNLKKMADDYALMEPERFCFMVNHEKKEEGVVETTYSNGTKVRVNYNDNTVLIDRNGVKTEIQA